MDDHVARLATLRALLRERGLDGLIVPRADAHLGENAPAHAERLAFLTGFTGSAGLAIVLADTAAVFSDGRYVLQLAAETDATLWTRLHLADTPPPEWLRARARAAGRTLAIGYDPRLASAEEVERYAVDGIALRPQADNPVDRVWGEDQPAPPLGPAQPHPERFAGQPSADKRAKLAAALRENGEAAAVVTDPASVAWLLNIRGSDLPHTPVALGFAILHDDGAVELFMDGRKLDAETRATLGNDVSVAEPDALEARLAALAGRRVRVDRAGSAAWFADTLRAAGAVVMPGEDPCTGPKARKNETEIAGARRAHLRDGVAIVRFLHWLEAAIAGGDAPTELGAAARLAAFRAEGAHFRGESFTAIVGAGEHGAIIHYRATEVSDRPIRPNELFLVDSGGQYDDGTTDITRTVWTGGDAPVPAAWRDQFTRVLQGLIAVADIVFPVGASGFRLDTLARAALWRAGLDYDHGTGHGVGSVLGVHEGPISISHAPRVAKLDIGMIVSDEPGYYLPGSHGIRIENLLLVEPSDRGADGRRFLGFETLTLAPIDRRCIEPALLDPAERRWLDAYHARVHAALAPHLDPAAASWLGRACAPV